MKRAILVASVVVLLPASVFAYINAGFRSRAQYQEYLREQKNIGRATAAINRDPNDAVAYFYRANVYTSLYHIGGEDSGRNYQQALSDYNTAIALDPRFAQAYLRRGSLRFSVHWPKERRETEMTKALADVDKAAQLNPKSVEAQILFAVHTQDTARAIQAMKRACEQTEYRREICLQLLASFYAEKGDFENAVRWQEKALKLKAFDPAESKKRLENYRNNKRNEWRIHWSLAIDETKDTGKKP